jgi:hypothetical protein
MLLNPLTESHEPHGRWPQRRQALPALLDVPSLQQIHMIRIGGGLLGCVRVRLCVCVCVCWD